ncbi:MAG: response regulator [Rubellimicrobium sp.]|nr:response regulator [Rubellimicrobium sp.]
MDTVTAPVLRPTAARPLHGMTVLLVEDSRLTSEAVRLMCTRSGARLLRADSLAHARRHLAVYRPGCVIVDLGLPDGSGAELLADLARARPRIDVLLGISGDPWAEGVALAAGADGFLGKPFVSLAHFQTMILRLLPHDRRPPGPRPVSVAPLVPDPAAWRDDLGRASDLLASGDNDMGYVAQFLAGVAASTGDNALAAAAAALAPPAGAASAAALARLRAMVALRLQDGPQDQPAS